MRVAHSASGKAVRPGPGWKRTSGPGRQAWQFSLALLLVTARAFSLPSLFVQLAVSGLSLVSRWLLPPQEELLPTSSLPPPPQQPRKREEPAPFLFLLRDA